MQRTFVRLLRTSDLSYIKGVHNELFKFPLQVSDEVLNEAVASAGRWTCLAAVQLQPGGEERMAGFILSAIGTAAEFQKGDYHLTDEDDDSQASSAAQHSTSGGSDVSQRDMGLQYLGLKPEDVVANVCLLGVMPDFRRSGVATQLFTQVINSARIARATHIFLHVLEGNQPALAFYKKQGFTVAGTVPRYYTLPGPQPGEVVHRDALLLSLDMSALAASTQQHAGSSAEGRLLASSAAYRAARRAAVAGTTAGTGGQGAAGAGAGGDQGVSAPRAAPAPKMRGLMGPSSSSRRPAARPAAAPPPALQQPKPRTSSSSQASSSGAPRDILGALGSWLRPGGQQQQQQEVVPPPAERVVVGDEQLLVVKGADQELHVVEPGDSNTSSTSTGGQQGGSTDDSTGRSSYSAQGMEGGHVAHSQTVGARDVRSMCHRSTSGRSREGLHRLPAHRAAQSAPRIHLPAAPHSSSVQRGLATYRGRPPPSALYKL